MILFPFPCPITKKKNQSLNLISWFFANNNKITCLHEVVLDMGENARTLFKSDDINDVYDFVDNWIEDNNIVLSRVKEHYLE